MAAPPLDPTLLRDLADGLDYLHGQLEETESELERARAQILVFEKEARHWEREASLLREEAAEQRGAIEELRDRLSSVEAPASTVLPNQDASAVSGTPTAAESLEDLVADQQKALVLSLELLKRLNSNGAPADESTRLERDRLEAALAREQAARIHAEQELQSERSQTVTMPLDDPELVERVQQLEEQIRDAQEKQRDWEAEAALQTAEVESRGAIIIALETALEEQNASLRDLEERFLAYADRVQAIQMERLEMPESNSKRAKQANGLLGRIGGLFSPSNSSPSTKVTQIKGR